MNMKSAFLLLLLVALAGTNAAASFAGVTISRSAGDSATTLRVQVLRVYAESPVRMVMQLQTHVSYVPKPQGTENRELMVKLEPGTELIDDPYLKNTCIQIGSHVQHIHTGKSKHKDGCTQYWAIRTERRDNPGARKIEMCNAHSDCWAVEVDISEYEIAPLPAPVLPPGTDTAAAQRVDISSTSLTDSDTVRVSLAACPKCGDKTARITRVVACYDAIPHSAAYTDISGCGDAHDARAIVYTTDKHEQALVSHAFRAERSEDGRAVSFSAFPIAEREAHDKKMPLRLRAEYTVDGRPFTPENVAVFDLSVKCVSGADCGTKSAVTRPGAKRYHPYGYGYGYGYYGDDDDGDDVVIIDPETGNVTVGKLFHDRYRYRYYDSHWGVGGMFFGYVFVTVLILFVIWCLVVAGTGASSDYARDRPGSSNPNTKAYPYPYATKAGV